MSGVTGCDILTLLAQSQSVHAPVLGSHVPRNANREAMECVMKQLHAFVRSEKRMSGSLKMSELQTRGRSHIICLEANV